MKDPLYMLWLMAATGLRGQADEPSMDHMEPISPLLLWALFALGMVVLSVVALVIVAAFVAVLAAIGMVSSATLVGVWRKRWSSGLRAFHYQVCAFIGLASGMGVAWMGVRLCEVPTSMREVVMVGSLAGLCSGMLAAFVIDRLVCMAHRRYFTKL